MRGREESSHPLFLFLLSLGMIAVEFMILLRLHTLTRTTPVLELCGLIAITTVVTTAFAYSFLANGLRRQQTRISALENDLHHFLHQSTEEGRYQALGGLSTVIAHDLSTSMHVVQFCCDQLRDQPALIHDPRYIQNLSSHAERSGELVQAVRAFLKTPPTDQKHSTFGEVCRHVLKLVSTRFSSDGYHLIALEMAPEMDTLKIEMPFGDLMHVLMTLLSNRVGHLLAAPLVERRLSIKTAIAAPERVQILISDTGAGLTPEKLRQMTAQHAPTNISPGAFDLRLVSRLLERDGGHLAVLPLPEYHQGTTLRLDLRGHV